MAAGAGLAVGATVELPKTPPLPSPSPVEATSEVESETPTKAVPDVPPVPEFRPAPPAAKPQEKQEKRLADPAAIARLLPPPLEPLGDVVLAHLYRMPDTDFLGSAHECNVMVGARLRAGWPLSACSHAPSSFRRGSISAW